VIIQETSLEFKIISLARLSAFCAVGTRACGKRIELEDKSDSYRPDGTSNYQTIICYRATVPLGTMALMVVAME
jgi:hypothetical protein